MAIPPGENSVLHVLNCGRQTGLIPPGEKIVPIPPGEKSSGDPLEKVPSTGGVWILNGMGLVGCITVIRGEFVYVIQLKARKFLMNKDVTVIV